MWSTSGTPTRPGLVLPVRVDPTGLTGPTPGQARGRHWRRVAPAWYVPADTDSSMLDQRIIEAVAGAPDDAAVTGWASFGWRGARWFNGVADDGRTPLDVPVALHQLRGVRRRAGVEFSEDWLFDDDVELVDGLRATVPERSVSYEALRARSLTAAVRTIDMAAASDMVDLTSLTRYATRLGPRPGIRLLRTALTWADENAWSPQEVSMRLTWRGHVGCELLTNRPIFDLRGSHLLTPDLLDPEAGVVGEYDGPTHLEESGRRRDLEREARYRDHGLELVTMMAGRRPDAASFLDRLSGAYGRACEGEDRHAPGRSNSLTGGSTPRRWRVAGSCRPMSVQCGCAGWPPDCVVPGTAAVSGADRRRSCRVRR